jgi:peroxiredoxin
MFLVFQKTVLDKLALLTTKNQHLKVVASLNRRENRGSDFQQDILQRVGHLGDTTLSKFDEVVASLNRRQLRDQTFQKDILQRVTHIDTTVSSFEARKDSFQDECFDQLLTVKKIVTFSNQILNRAVEEAGIKTEVLFFSYN